MRRLVWFSVGFAAACALGGYAPLGDIAFMIAGISIIIGMLLLFVPPKKLAQRIFAAILVGLSLGSIWMQVYQQMHLLPAREADGSKVSGYVEICDYSFETTTGIGVDGYMQVNGGQYRVCLYVKDVQSLAPGDRVYGTFSLEFTGGDDLSYLQSQGITFRVFTKKLVRVVRAQEVPIGYLPAVFSREIMKTLESVFPDDTIGFAKALLLGDSSDLSIEQDIAFRNSGIRHVIAVSGMHVSILFSLVFLLTGHRRILTPLLGAPVLLLFAAIAGFTPSVNRACLMQGMMLLALLFDREYDPPTSLAFAVLVLLLQNPMTITSVGFQLSVSCVIGIFLFYKRIQGFLLTPTRLGDGKGKDSKASLTRWLAGSVSMSLSALAFTMPLSAFYFQAISPISVLTNLLTLWAVTGVFYGIMAACIVGAIWLPLGSLAAWIVSWPMRYITWIAGLVGKLPVSYVPADNVYMLLWLCFVYILCFAFWKSKKRRIWLLTLLASASFLISSTASISESHLDKFRLTVLDVGQGQCILLQSNGYCYMVDCGGDSGMDTASLAVRTLWSNGIYRLDGIVLTHYDADHVGGIEPFLVQMGSDKLYMPVTEDKENLQQSIVRNYRGNIAYVQEQCVLPCGNGTITIFPAPKDAKGNESSLCILFQAEDCDILITGDRDMAGELQLMEQTDLPDLEVLVVGHHGSKSSTGINFLRQTMPEIAVISVGEDNPYDHPNQETLDRLELFECEILRTDQQGTIIIRR